MTDRRIAQRFSVLATLEDSKLGTLFLSRDDDRGGHALLLVLAATLQPDDATLAAIAAETAPDTLPTTAWGRGDDGVWLAVAAPVVAGADACTLEQVIKRRDKLELAHILRAAVALARGVAHLGTLGHRHADISPGRVWLPSGVLTSGTPLLFGSGWWRLLPAYQANAAADTFYGNPEYLAAELCKGLAATPTTDVYGAATTIWALAAGKPPFPSNQPLMALKRQAVEKPLRLDLVKPGLAGVKDLQALLADALDKDPTRRPAPAAWVGAVEALAGQKAPEALLKEALPASAHVAPAALTAETIHLSASVMAAAVAASASELAAAAAEPAPTPAPVPTDLPAKPAETVAESAVLDSLPTSAPADADDGVDLDIGDETDESGAPRTGKRRRERRERQTVAGIGIAAALAERNLEEQAAGTSPTPTLVGLKPDPKAAPALDGGMLRSTPPASRPGSGAVTSQLAAVPPAGVPKRPESGSAPKVVIKGQQPSAAASGMTDRVRAEIAQGAFFEEDVAPSAPVDMADLVPPTPPTEKVNRKALLSILGFAGLMLGVSTWMSTRQPTPEPKAPAEEPVAQAPAEPEEDVVAAPEDVSVAEAAPAPAVVTPVEAAPAADAAAVAAAEPDAGAPAAAPDVAVAAAVPPAPVTVPAVGTPPVVPPAAPAPTPPTSANLQRTAQVQKLVAEGRSALSTKDPVTALARAKDALALDAGNAPAALLREEASRAVDAAAAEAKAREAKASAEEAALARAEAARAKADSDRISKAEAAKRAAAEKAEAKRAAAEKKNEKVAAARRAKEAAAAKVAAAKAAKAAKAREKKAKAKAARQKAPVEKPAVEKSAPAPKPAPAAKAAPAPAPAAKPVAKVEDAGSGSSEAAKFAALAQKASKAKLKVLYLQKALKLDPNNAGYKAQLKSAEEQLKTEAP